MQEKTKYDRKDSTRKSIRFNDELYAKIRRNLKGESFSKWVQDACRDKLDK